MFSIRQACPEDLSRILPVYDRARAFMAANGNPDQWGDRHPDEGILSRDIQNKPPCLSLISTTINETSQPIIS